MKIVRNKIFETNSSSSHVIAININKEAKPVPLKIDITIEDTGYIIEEYTPGDKLNYLYNYILCTSNPAFYLKKLYNLCNKYDITLNILPPIEYKNKYFGIPIEKRIEEVSQINESIKLGFPNNSIDTIFALSLGIHIDTEFLDDVLSDETLFKNYIFCKKSFVIYGYHLRDEFSEKFKKVENNKDFKFYEYF